MMHADQEARNRINDRILELQPIDGKTAKSSTGLVDTRLFTGEQKLHIKMDPDTMLWNFQYSNNGLLPEALKGRFTGFKQAIKFAENYFQRRNIQIVQVRD